MLCRPQPYLAHWERRLGALPRPIWPTLFLWLFRTRPSCPPLPNSVSKIRPGLAEDLEQFPEPQTPATSGSRTFTRPTRTRRMSGELTRLDAGTTVHGPCRETKLF